VTEFLVVASFLSGIVFKIAVDACWHFIQRRRISAQGDLAYAKRILKNAFGSNHEDVALRMVTASKVTQIQDRLTQHREAKTPTIPWQFRPHSPPPPESK
jgi:hypothetical protein